MNFKCIIVMAIIGFICIITGFTALFGIMPKMIHNKITDKFMIKNNTEQFDRFKVLPVPLLWSMYFFNITNPDDFDGKEVSSVKFQQVGPYVYEESREKKDDMLSFSPDGSNVTYKESKTFKFRKDLSKGTENDIIVTFNLFHGSDKVIIDAFTKGPNVDPKLMKPTLTAKVINLAFDSNDPNFWLGKSLFTKQLQDYSTITVNTGKENIDNLEQVLQIDGSEFFPDINLKPIWNEPEGIGECNKLAGTDGTQFKPGLTGDEKLWVFEPMLCRKLSIENKPLPNIEVKGISTLRYVVQPYNFDRSLPNRCYCLEDSEDKCDNGLLNLRKCAASQEVEIIASPPFFYSNLKLFHKTGLSSAIDIKQVTMENYGSMLDIEPNTGLVLKATKRLQLNLKLRKGILPVYNNLNDNENWGFQVAPLMWLEESAEIDQKNVDKLNDELFSQKKLFSGLLISLTVLGFVLLAVSGVWFYCSRDAKH